MSRPAGYHHTPSTRRKISQIVRGRKWPLSSRLAIQGSGNHNWKGSHVGLAALHDWVESRKPRPAACDTCGAITRLDLANRSGRYLRSLTDWDYLCRRCHMQSDGRLQSLIDRARARRIADRYCLWCKRLFRRSSYMRVAMFCSNACRANAYRGVPKAEWRKRYSYADMQ